MRGAPAERAAKHHSTLNAFAAVTVLLEGGLVYDPDEYQTVEKILRLCKDAQQRQLRKYDSALSAGREGHE